MPTKPLWSYKGTRDDLRVCNCAGCHEELLGPDRENVFLAMKLSGPGHAPRVVQGRINDRPYCLTCWRGRGNRLEPLEAAG